MKPTIVQPAGLWDPRPRFAQVVRAGKQIYIAGQTAMDERGQVVGRGEVDVQARQIFENLRKCLESVGAGFDQVVKLNIYATDLDAQMEIIGKLRREYFREPVASTTVQISRLVHPDCLLEIEAIAELD